VRALAVRQLVNRRDHVVRRGIDHLGDAELLGELASLGCDVDSGDARASGLDQPFGIAFYPSGSDPQWIYIANTGSVVRYPYRSGDLKARGKGEVIVRDLPHAGGRSV